MPAIRLIAFDLDGTALNSRKEITPRLKQAFAAAQNAGILLVPASGRGAKEIAQFQLPTVEYAICGNGARVYSLRDNTLLRSCCFSPEEALALLSELLRRPAVCACCYETENRAALGRFSPLGRFAAEKLLRRTGSRAVGDLAGVIRKTNQPVDKFLQFFFSERQRLRALAFYRTLPGCCPSSSFPHSLELNAPGANKGAALDFLAKHLGIAPEQVMAAGDNLNDLETLRFAGHSVAMGNAVPEAKAAAKHTTGSCDEDGLANAIEAVL